MTVPVRVVRLDVAALARKKPVLFSDEFGGLGLLVYFEKAATAGIVSLKTPVYFAAFARNFSAGRILVI